MTLPLSKPIQVYLYWEAYYYDIMIVFVLYTSLFDRSHHHT